MSENVSTEKMTQSETHVRTEFSRKTYMHIAFAILCFAGLEYVLLSSDLAPTMVRSMTSGFHWLIVLGAFIGVSWVADYRASISTSIKTLYAGLVLYIVAEAIIFVPLLYIASLQVPNVIPTAGIIIGLLFGGLAFAAFTSRSDSTLLSGILKISGFIALGVIVLGIMSGFNLDILFSSIIIAFVGCAILYSTSNILKHYKLK